MDLARSLDIALSVLSILLVLGAGYGVWVVVSSARALAAAAEDVRVRLVPLLEKADITLDAVNAELLRIDAIVSQAEEVGEAVSNASDFIRSPVNSAAQKLARMARSFRNR